MTGSARTAYWSAGIGRDSDTDVYNVIAGKHFRHLELCDKFYGKPWVFLCFADGQGLDLGQGLFYCGEGEDGHGDHSLRRDV